MLKFIHHLPRFLPKYPRIQHNVIRTSKDYKSRVTQCLKGKASTALAIGTGGVVLWLGTTTIAAAEGAYRYGLQDKDNIQKMEELFCHYASVNKDGELVMTKEDFINSVLDINATPEERARISACFELADINKDHYISFFEYALFMHLTDAPDASLQMSFRLFDTNGDGHITLEEFHNVISLHTLNVDVQEKCARQFGDDGKKELNYTEFIELLGTINQDILIAQFKLEQLPNKPDFINPDRCAELLKSRAPSPTPLYLIENFNSMIKSKEPISLTEYLAYLEVMKQLDNIELGIELFTITGGSIDKQNFPRAMNICTGKILSDTEVDVIFRMFGASDKGVLDRQSLLYIRSKSERLWINQSDNRPILPLIKSLLLGAVAAKVSTLIVYPLDKIKARLQLTPIQLHAMTSAVKRIYLKEGIKGYLRGVSSMLAVVTPEKAIKLYVSDFVRLHLERSSDNKASSKLLKNVLTGMATGVAQALIVNPFEQVKIKMQMLEHKAKDGVWRSLYKLGLGKFYRGLSITLIRDISFNITYFVMFSWGKIKFQNENRLSGFYLFVAHATAATLAVMVSAPADTVRSHFHYSSQNTSPLQCYQSILSQEGYHGLFKGTVPRSIVAVTLFALTFIIFELLQRTFAPGTVLGLSTWQRDFDLVRANRLHNLEKTLKREFGLELQRISVHSE